MGWQRAAHEIHVGTLEVVDHVGKGVQQIIDRVNQLMVVGPDMVSHGASGDEVRATRHADRKVLSS